MMKAKPYAWQAMSEGESRIVVRCDGTDIAVEQDEDSVMVYDRQQAEQLAAAILAAADAEWPEDPEDPA